MGCSAFRDSLFIYLWWFRPHPQKFMRFYCGRSWSKKLVVFFFRTKVLNLPTQRTNTKRGSHLGPELRPREIDAMKIMIIVNQIMTVGKLDFCVMWKMRNGKTFSFFLLYFGESNRIHFQIDTHSFSQMFSFFSHDSNISKQKDEWEDEQINFFLFFITGGRMTCVILFAPVSTSYACIREIF